MRRRPRETTLTFVDEMRESCPVCSGRPRVLVALEHPLMRQFTLELLERDHGCWRPMALEGVEPLQALTAIQPDLVVLDAATFQACQCRTGCGYPCHRMVVIGPEPGSAYRSAALGEGAGGWVARDDIGDQLSRAMRDALGCCHDGCPPARSEDSVTARSDVP